MKVVLILLLASSGWSGESRGTTVYFNTMDECLAVLKETKIIVPVENDGNEWAGAATCGYKRK